MYFTQDDYRKIEEWLRKRVIKDTDFKAADPLTGKEKIALIQDNENKIMSMYDFVYQVALMKLPDFFNITVFTRRANLSLECAIDAVPVEQRKLGMVITFRDERGNWVIFQFKGTSLNQWNSLNYWDNIIAGAIEDMLLYPDEEDITAVEDNNRLFLKFKNKDYNPEEFSGLGRIYLRKNYVGTDSCAIDDEDHLSNILTQDMIREANTIYIIQYDYDLDGGVISIPDNCILWFQGGSINNGSIYMNGASILGAWEFADMGDAKLFGDFNTGQIMTFSDDSYQRKEGGYFVASTKESSATKKEDPKQDRETFYAINSNAYVTETRQELRWWNGEEWIRILDIVDYNEIISIIHDLIDKHNAEMSACYKYFKARLHELESRVEVLENWRTDTVDPKLKNLEDRVGNTESRLDNHDTTLADHEKRIKENTGSITSIEKNISNIENNITNIQNFVENIDNTILNNLEQYFETNIVGAQTITVNGETYSPDDKGNITLPDYPAGGGGTGDVQSEDFDELKKRVDKIEDALVNIQATTITVINLQPEDNEVNITVEATNIDGRPVNTEFSVDLNNSDFTLIKS